VDKADILYYMKVDFDSDKRLLCTPNFSLCTKIRFEPFGLG